MHVLLNPGAVRKLELVNILKSHDGFHAVMDLGAKLGVTKTTLRKSLNELAEDLPNCDVRVQLVYEESSHRHVKLINSKSNLNHRLTSYYLQQEYSFKAFLDIFNNPDHDFKQFYEGEFVSLSTAYRETGKMKRILKKFDLKLDYTQAFPIKGTERQLRYFYACFFWSAYDENYWCFNEPRLRIENLISHLEKNKYLFVPPIEREFFIMWTAIVIERLRTGNSGINHNAKKISLGPTETEELEAALAFVIHEWQLEAPKRLELELELKNLIVVRNLFTTEISDGFLETLENSQLNQVVSQIVAKIEEALTIKLTQGQREFMYTHLLVLHSKKYFFVGEPSDFYIREKKSELEQVRYEIKTFVYEKIRALDTSLAYRNLVEDSETLASAYFEVLLKMLRMEPANLKLKVGIFTIEEERGVWRNQRYAELAWFDPIEFVTDFSAPRDVNLSDRYFKHISEMSAELFVISSQPTEAELGELGLIYWQITFQKIKDLFK